MGNILLRIGGVLHACLHKQPMVVSMLAAILGIIAAANLVRGVSAAAVPARSQDVVVPAACNAHVEGGSTFGSADASAVQQAVEAASAGANIIVAGTCAGVVSRAGNDQSVYVTQTVMIQGGYDSTFTTHDPDIHPTTIDALDLGRVVLIAGASADVLLADLILQGGAVTGASGAGIFNGAATLTITDSLIYDNHASDHGGGIYNVLSELTLDNTEVLSNTAGMNGGGIYSAQDLAVVSAPDVPCLPEAAAADFGESSVTLENGSELGGNTANGEGGGLYGANSLLGVDGSLIQHNTAVNGGGIYGAWYHVILKAPGGTSITDDPFFLDA